MTDDASGESGVDNTETLPPNVQYNVQYVGDNIELNIVSINGNTAFHAMDMIKVNSESSSMTDEYFNSKLSRLRLKPSDRTIRYWGLEIFRPNFVVIQRNQALTPLSSNH